MDRVRVAQWGGKHIVYMPIYVSVHRGYFRDLGLHVELYHAGNDDQIYSEVVNGHAHFGVGDPTFVAHGSLKGDDTKVIAAIVNKGATWGYTHHPEIHPIRTADDCVGLRFGTYPSPSTTHALITHIKESHPNRLRTMEIVQAQIGELTPLLARGQVDVVIEVEPMISIAEQQGLRVVFSAEDLYPPMLYTGVTARSDYLESHADIAQHFVIAIQEGLTTCHREPNVLLTVAREIFPAIPDTCMEAAINRMLSISTWPEQALIQASSWHNALKLREDLGQLNSIEDAASLLEQQFAYKAITSGV